MSNKRLMRIRRLVEYVGEPEAVLAQLAISMKEGSHDLGVAGPTRGPARMRVTVSQLGPAEMIDGEGLAAALEENARDVNSCDCSCSGIERCGLCE